MKTGFLKRLKTFFRASLVGGVAAILPLALIVLAIRWIINLVTKYLEPVVRLIEDYVQIPSEILYVLVVIAILFLFFFIGMVIQTRIGRFFNHVLEEKYLMKIPGYKIVRDAVMQIFGKNKSFFSEVVLVDIFGSGTLMTGFITDDYIDYVTVFVPTGPNPINGNIYHVKKDKIVRTKISVDSGIKTIISCGAGSNEILKEKYSDED